MRLECRGSARSEAGDGSCSQNGTISRESSGRLFHMQGRRTAGRSLAPPSGRTMGRATIIAIIVPKLPESATDRRKDTRADDRVVSISMQMLPPRARVSAPRCFRRCSVCETQRRARLLEIKHRSGVSGVVLIARYAYSRCLRTLNASRYRCCVVGTL